jgi:hypothetical protein
MIGFKELPDDGIMFEQLIRELLVLEGFDVRWTGVGQDGGRDLVIKEKLIGELSNYIRTWLVRCKHFAHSGKSIGVKEIGDITSDCKAIGAEGYILVCSTQPTASLVKRLEEIQTHQNIITKCWDAIEIEKRLNKPNTFGLIHTFFPESSKRYEWKIYNAYSPAFWAANYRGYFFYMSCRHSNTYPYLESIEAIVDVFERIKLFKNENDWDSHYLRLRCVYFDDKHSNHIAYLDYIYPKESKKDTIIRAQELEILLNQAFNIDKYKILNEPTWDVRYIPETTSSDGFMLDHKTYYEPYMKNFETGSPREDFLHDLVFQLTY